MPTSHTVRTIAALLAVAGGLAASILVLTGSGGHRHAPFWGRSAAPNAAHEAAFERRHGGEANREGPSDPASEQVANRAYPRNYVDDRLALRSRRAYESLPTSGAARRSRTAARTLAPTTPWTELGPFTPNVSGIASQFFDPNTLTGPTTQESGRVTALAIDPACTSGNCRLWVAAAGGGIWRTPDALAAHPTWTPPPADLPTNSFGSLYYDAAHDVLYAGSGEPNGSGDSEAGLGLYRSTDGGASWSLVPGSASVATNRSVGAIAIDPSDPTGHTIVIGTDVARHGSSAVNGGRRTPPNAPALGVYRSTDNGATFTLETGLASQTPANPAPPSDGSDWFQGGINKLEFDPTAHELYAAVQGYGLWRKRSGTWEQVFRTMNQNDFSEPHAPAGDLFGDRTEFDFVTSGGHTRAYLGDASDDFVLDDDPATPLPEAFRVDSIDTATAATLVGTGNNAGWTMLSSPTPGDPGFAAYGFCQNGQCGYDEFVAAADAGTVWLGGSMNYDELPAYDMFGTGAPPRSNGRAVIRSTDAGVNWRDMTAVLSGGTSPGAWGVASGIHPDLHAIAFADGGNTAFVGSDGGVVRIDVASPVDQSSSCGQRRYAYDPNHPDVQTALVATDLSLCQELLAAVPSAVTPLNDGLRTMQFQSVSANPATPTSNLLGGTQDNGTWSFTGQPAWLESIGGDGGQSGFDKASPGSVSFHNYYDATPEVNFHAADPTKWLDIYDPLQITGESRSFYTPFIADPTAGGRLFTGLQHVWRTDDDGGKESDLIANGCYAYTLDPFRTTPCGDWFPIGDDLTSNTFKGDRTGQYVVATTRAPSDTGTLWAATRTGRVFVTKNADAGRGPDVEFYRVDTPTTPGRFVSGIAVDPANANHAWVSYSGYNAYTPDTPGHVFDVLYDPSTHQATFTDLSYDLGDQPVTGIAEDGDTGDVFAATDFGVATLAPGASQWVKAGSGLPAVAVYGLTLAQGAHTLFAATHGRGVWSIAVPAAAPPSGGGGGGTPLGKPTGAISGPLKIEVGHKATYTATGSTPNTGPVTFAWTLPGTPKSATGSSATFTPHQRGTAQIVVTVTDASGQSTTITKAVRIVDTTPPTARLRRIARVRRGRSSVIRGTAFDAGGLRSLRIAFGDGQSRAVLRHGRRTFRLTHRYLRRGSHLVTLTAIDHVGHRTRSSAIARVR